MRQGLALLWLLLIGALPGAAAAAVSAPVDLRVADGGDHWRRSNRFRLDWDLPAPGFATIPAAFEIFDQRGLAVVGPRPVVAGTTTLDLSYLLPRPGAYRLELRYVTAEGPGDPAVAALRFDDARPGRAIPRPPAAWVGRNSFPLRVEIEPPSALPVSGLAGYAVTVGGDPIAEPCRSIEICDHGEVDLDAGAGALPIHDLPAGTSWVNVVAVSGSGMRSLEPGRGSIRVDDAAPATTIDGVPAGWVNRPVTLAVSAADPQSGMSGDGLEPEPFTAIRIDGSVPTTSPGSAVSATLAAEGVHTIEHYARDEAGNVDDGGTSNGRPNGEPGRAIVRIDRTPPRVGFSRAQSPTDPELIVATVADPASGASPNRGSIAVRRAGSADPFRRLATRASEGILTARWDSGAVAPGLYEFRAQGLDRAGNATGSTTRIGGEPMLLRAPLRAATRLRLTRPGRVPARGGPATIRGRLSTAMGTAVPGAAITLIERFAPGSSRVERAQTVRSRADGSFTARLRAGPSRAVSARFGGSPTLAGSRSASAAVRVRPRLRLAASASSAAVGGRPVIFRGRVAVPPAEVPADGKAIALEFRLPGTRWTAFRTVRTDRRGRFRLPYRFEDDDSRGVAFRFRAVATAESGWPFERAASRGVTVRGR